MPPTTAARPVATPPPEALLARIAGAIAWRAQRATEMAVERRSPHLLRDIGLEAGRRRGGIARRLLVG